jgi:acyl carrier protein
MQDKFLELIRDVLEINDRDLNMTDEFRNYVEWNSLANLSLIALLDEEYGVVIEYNEFRNLNTLLDIFERIQKK